MSTPPVGSMSAGSSRVTTSKQATSRKMAPQARAMLALMGHAGANRNVIVNTGASHGSFVAVKPDSKTSLYDSIIVNKAGKTSSYITSVGFEATGAKEFGDGLAFTLPSARLQQVSFIFDSWGCESGFWNDDTCSTTKGATFEEPITANIYDVDSSSGKPEPGQLIATKTQTFAIPYRPSANNTICQGPNLGKYLGPVDKECDNGLATKVTFNFKLPKLILPAQAIVTVAYNTSDSGYAPYGQNTACFTGPGGCGYDSLNVSADGNGGPIGTVLDPNGVYDLFSYTPNYCDGMGNGTGTLQLDTAPDSIDCWAGYHPEINVTGK
jgi:hypothetical protein